MNDWNDLFLAAAALLGTDLSVAPATVLRVDDGPTGTFERLVDNAHALHSSAGTIAADEGVYTLHGMLALNAPGRHAPAHVAIDPVSGDRVRFIRFDDPSDWTAESFATAVASFLQAGRDEPREPAQAPHDEPGNVNEEAFESLWAEYVFRCGLSRHDHEPRGEHGYMLVPDGGGLVSVRPEAGGTVLVTAVLAFLPLAVRDEAPLLRRLLEANLLGEATRGACLGLDDSGSEVLAWRRVPLDHCDAARLEAVIHNVAITAAYFSELLELPLAAVSGSAVHAPA